MPRTKKAGFKCRICGKSFGMAMHLGRHMASHGQAPGRSVAASPNQTASVGAADQLAALIAKLQAQRQQHEDAIAQIDATFEQFGISAAPAKKRRGRPRKTTRIGQASEGAKKTAKKAKKGKTQSPSYVRHERAGVNSWVCREGGEEGCDDERDRQALEVRRTVRRRLHSLGALVKQKQLKKEKIEGAKGSRYTAA